VSRFSGRGRAPSKVASSVTVPCPICEEPITIHGTAYADGGFDADGGSEWSCDHGTYGAVEEQVVTAIEDEDQGQAYDDGVEAEAEAYREMREDR
jgi:hypothetical protein